MKARIILEEKSRDYELGEAIRSHSDMIAEAAEVNTLENGEFAFVRRSNGSYSYAILFEHTEDCMVFVIDDAGATKRISKKHWSNMVRLVSR